MLAQNDEFNNTRQHVEIILTPNTEWKMIKKVIILFDSTIVFIILRNLRTIWWLFWVANLLNRFGLCSAFSLHTSICNFVNFLFFFLKFPPYFLNFCCEAWAEVKVQNSRKLKRYVSQDISNNSWNAAVSKVGVSTNLYSTRLCCILYNS